MMRRDCRRCGGKNMRVITGSARGRRLGELKGMETRPTTDKVKESIFNCIQFDVENARVLDLFAGSGQMGIEALSRGAQRAVFVDMRSEACTVIRGNLEKTRLLARAQIVRSDFQSYLTRCREQFDLIFLDPPYDGIFLENAMKSISEIDILSDCGILICERPAEKALPAQLGALSLRREYRYGRASVSIYGKNSDLEQPL